MNCLCKLLIAASTLLVLTGFTVNIKKIKTINVTKNTKSQVELMFYQHAKQARLSVNEDKKDCYTLTLFEISPNVIYFSNHPSHVSGIMHLDKFNTSMQHAQEIKGIKPNAVLHAYQNKNYAEQSTIDMTVTLSDVKYNHNAKTTSYTTCPLYESKKLTLAAKSPATALYEVNLFIDDFPPWPP
jgi:hypothetical protein